MVAMYLTKTIVQRCSDLNCYADISDFIHRLMTLRDAQGTADYSLKNMLAPTSMKGIEAAVLLLDHALQAQQNILIVGDFDADGATSTALLYRCLRAFGFHHVNFLVPNRFEFGYGLTPEIVDLAASQSPDLIITVDNGISSIDGVVAAKQRGIKVLVTDHHLPGAILPDADAIVNPNQPGCEFGSKNLAGVGVIFYVMMALRAHLRDNSWFATQELLVPNMAQFLDLVALGTVADVVPLDGNNRILVAQGIERIRAGASSAGILAMLKVANRNAERIVADDFGFAVGPRLNAAGRLDDMSIGIRCLLSDNWVEALGIAQELDSLNQQRKAIESSMQVEAIRDLDNINLGDGAEAKNGICLFRDDWHQGVVGIVASRIKDRTHRPTVAFSRVDDNELKGSGRSIPGVHLRDVLDEIATKNPGLLTKFGGHAMAAGMSLKESALAEFSLEFDSVVGKYLTDDMREPLVHSDGSLDPHQLTLAYAEAIRQAGPWGQTFPEPQFDGLFRLVNYKRVGANHLKMMLSLGEFSEIVLDAIAFNVDEALWPTQDTRMLRVVYKLDVNEYRGRQSLQLMVVYFELC